MKRFLPIGLLISLSLLCTMSPLSATHFMGVEMTYECMGSDIYRIYFRGYYDCTGGLMLSTGAVPIDTSGINAPVPPNASTFFFNYTSGCANPVQITPWLIESYQDVTPICPIVQSSCEFINGSIYGVAEATYYVDYDFSMTSCTSYTAFFEECCRNNTITSVFAPDNQSLYLQAFEMNVDSTVCNNSPVIIEDPAVYICGNTMTAISQEAFDVDGDSLAYSLVASSTDFGAPVPYLFGYSPVDPLGPNWNVQINPTTGWLTFAPVGVGSPEVGIMAIRVDEYRNGIWIGQITRDIQVTVLSCGNSQVPVAGGLQVLSGGSLIGIDTVQACPGTPLVFSVSVQDADTGDVVTITSDLSQSLPGSMVTTSGVNPATIQVSWTPPASLYGQVVPWLLSAQDDACPTFSEIFQNYYVSLTGTCLSGTVTNSACNDSTGAIDLQVYGGAPPYTFLWSNGETTEDLTTLSPGMYWVDVNDVNGFLGSDTFYVNSLELIITDSMVSPTCDAPDGSISLNVSGGTAPYTFAWTNGDTGNQISGLAAGGYAVDITDSTGCFSHAAFLLAAADSCEITIEGTVYYDANANCVQDPGEFGLPFYYLDLAPGGAIYTDLNGNYSLSVELGAHTLTGIPNPFAYSAIYCPADSQHEFLFTSYDDDTSGVDFAVDLIPSQDLFVSLSYGPPPVPGMPWSLTILAANLGNVPASPATLNFQHDPAIDFVSSSPAGTYTAATQNLEWQFPTLASGQFEWVTVQFMLDSTALLGDTLSFFADIIPVVGDTTPANNYDTIHPVVVAAYDPNAKRVEQGIGPLGLIENHQQQLDYTIYFQNTGNWPATYVIIRDTIDAHLDLSTFRGLGQSHGYIAEVEEDSILVFRFDNINLPDSATDLTGSVGFVSYQLSHAGNLPLGSQITNSAAIYFDFNPPIFTNEVVNTIFRPMSIGFEADIENCEGDPIMGFLDQTGLPPFDFVWGHGEQMLGTTDTLSAASLQAGEWYQLTVTDALGVSVTDSIQLSVTPLPVASATTSIQGLAVTFQDASVAADNWFWDFGDGATSTDPSPTHTYASSGGYMVRLIVENKCGRDTSLIALPLTTSLAELSAATVSLQPNPFSTTSLLSFPNPSQHAYRLQLTDLRGRLVQEYPLSRGTSFEIIRKELKTGLYLYHLIGDTEHFVGKVLIQ